jgi:hypothetical protein
MVKKLFNDLADRFPDGSDSGAVGTESCRSNNRLALGYNLEPTEKCRIDLIANCSGTLMLPLITSTAPACKYAAPLRAT